MTCNIQSSCPDAFGCDPNVCPDFLIKRHSTKPAMEVSIKDCGQPIDLTDTVLEVSMWANAKLKSKITVDDTDFGLADNIGFQQISIGDIIVVDRVRSPEQMLVTGIDENNFLIRVQRGYNGTAINDYKKGTKLKSFRFLNAIGETEITLRDIEQEDGTVEKDVLSESKLIYSWGAADTCLPGCYNLEMKLLKMIPSVITPVPNPISGNSFSVGMNRLVISVIPSFISYSTSQVDCALGNGVEWVRRFPVSGYYLIKIDDSPIING